MKNIKRIMAPYSLLCQVLANALSLEVKVKIFHLSKKL